MVSKTLKKSPTIKHKTKLSQKKSSQITQGLQDKTKAIHWSFPQEQEGNSGLQKNPLFDTLINEEVILE